MVQVELIDGAAEDETSGLKGLVGDGVVVAGGLGFDLSGNGEVFVGFEAERGGERTGDYATQKHCVFFFFLMNFGVVLDEVD